MLPPLLLLTVLRGVELQGVGLILGVNMGLSCESQLFT